MVKNDFYFDDEQDIIDMMFGNYDSDDEVQEAYGDMMNSFDED